MTHLTLNCYTFNLPPKFSHFSSLTSLSLKCVPMTQENLLNILSSCLSLQWLSLIKCYSSSCLKFSPSLKLNHLNIWNFKNLKKVDISALENLTSFEISGDILTELLCNREGHQLQGFCMINVILTMIGINMTLFYISPRMRVSSNVRINFFICRFLLLLMSINFPSFPFFFFFSYACEFSNVC